MTRADFERWCLMAPAWSPTCARTSETSATRIVDPTKFVPPWPKIQPYRVSLTLLPELPGIPVR
jgi:hypothetical protein